LARAYAAAVIDGGSVMLGRYEALSQTRKMAFDILNQEADVKVLRGWLLLEAGNIAPARQELVEALDLGRVRADESAAGAAVGTTLLPAQTQHLPAQGQLLNLHALPLATTGLRWIENAAR